MQFDLASLTHRRNSLDIAKLNYLNKHHLMLKWATPDGLEALARRIRPMIKEAFPTSQYTSIQDIMKFILALEVRLTSLLRSDVIWLIIELQSRFTTVDDIPYMGPFFFLDPDLSSEEARSMAKSFANSDHGKLFFFFSLLISCLRTFLSAPPSTNARARFSQVGRTARGLGRLGYIFTYSHRKSGFKYKPENVHVDLAICVDWHEGSSNSPLSCVNPRLNW